jgi:hypothetical protein
LNFYFTTGDSGFMVISEANEAESIIAALLAAVVAEKASKAASQYRAPGNS